MRHMLVRSIIAVAIFATLACSGGGGGSNSGNSTPLPDNTSLGRGIWSGTLHSDTTNQTTDVLAVMLETGEFRYVSSNLVQASGKIIVQGSAASGTGTMFAPYGMTFAGGQTIASFFISNGQMIPKSTFRGNYSGGGDNGSFSLNYSSVTDIQTTIAANSGTFTANSNNISTGVSTTVKVTSTGVLTGSDYYGSISGTVTQPNPSLNLFQVNATYTQSGYSPINYSGIGYFIQQGLTTIIFQLQMSSSTSQICGSFIGQKIIAPLIHYSSGGYQFTTGTAITTLTPTNTGGNVETWSVSPQPPAGLSFNISNGYISGTPSAIVGSTEYVVAATNGAGTSSVTLNLTVNPPPPIITSQPVNKIVRFGETATFSVTATGTGNLNYQWRKGGNPISGANTTTLTISNSTNLDNNSQFDVIVIDSYNGNTQSSIANLKVVEGLFSTSGSLVKSRIAHTMTLLNNGKVLIVGGYTSGGNLIPNNQTAEIYDPSTGMFTATGGLSISRYSHTATLLLNGKVLITGGYNGSNVLTTSELYDPSSGSFTLTGNLGIGRDSHTATLLPNGNVAIIGGSVHIGTSSVQGVEIYNSTLGTFTIVGSMTTPRMNHTSSLLLNNKILIAGGYGINSVYTTLSSAELFDYVSYTFTPINSMSVPRRQHLATTLSNNKILISGGYNQSTELNTTEIFDPSSNTFSSSGNFITSKSGYTATLINNGKVLFIGGLIMASETNGAELYDPTTDLFTATGPLNTGRYLHAAVLLPNGSVFVSGGRVSAGNVAISSSEIYK